MDHFDLEKVMKVPQILHFKCGQQLGLHTVDFSKVGVSDDQVIYIQQYTDRAFWTFLDEQQCVKI